MTPKYYIIKFNHGHPDYLRNTKEEIFEYESEKEVRENLIVQKKLNPKYTLCWKKDKLMEN